MHIEHIALWTHDLEGLQDFYTTYFGARAGDRYRNLSKGFESCFLSFDSGARIELMCSTMLELVDPARGSQQLGWTHLAISLGSESAVDTLTKQLLVAGYPVLDGPRRTGDGYYESVILDPDGNRIEITA